MLKVEDVGGTFATYYSQPLAQKATADANGNIIADTYASITKLTELENKIKELESRISELTT